MCGSPSSAIAVTCAGLEGPSSTSTGPQGVTPCKDSGARSRRTWSSRSAPDERRPTPPAPCHRNLRSEARSADSVEVESRTLDELALDLGPPDLIKIDVEGLELDVVRGGESLLATCRPHLLVEFHDSAEVPGAQGLLAGYSFQPLSGQHWLLERRP